MVVSSAGQISSEHEFVIVIERLFGICAMFAGGGTSIGGDKLGGVAVEEAKAVVAAVVGIWV